MNNLGLVFRLFYNPGLFSAGVSRQNKQDLYENKDKKFVHTIFRFSVVFFLVGFLFCFMKAGVSRASVNPVEATSNISSSDTQLPADTTNFRHFSTRRQKKLLVGITYPGVTVGYQGSSFGGELRAYTSNDIVLFGPRFTHYPLSYNGGNLYWGTDLFYISEFEGDLTEGEGIMAGCFLGLQHYLGSSFSITFDSGPYYIELADDLSGLETEGWEFVINSSINFHF